MLGKINRTLNVNEYQLDEDEMLDLMDTEGLTPVVSDALENIQEDDLIEFMHGFHKTPTEMVSEVQSFHAVYPNGKLLLHGQTKNKKPFGPQVIHYENGEVKLFRNYNENGERHGFGGYMHEDGETIKVYETYYKGKKEGKWIYFDESGQPTKLMGYKNDKKCLPTEINFKKIRILSKEGELRTSNKE